MSKIKKNLKKIISSVLAFAMVFGMGFSSVTSVNVEASSDTGSSDGKYTVTLADTENGKIEFNDNSGGRYAKGDNVCFSLTADNGYVPAKVVINATDTGEEIVHRESSDNLFSFTMPGADLTVCATFTNGDAHTVELVQGEGGTVAFEDSNEQKQDFVSGDTVTVTVEFDTESPSVRTNIYTESGEWIDGYWTDDYTFTFDMPEENVTISPEYFGVTDEWNEFMEEREEHEEALASVPQTLASETGVYRNGTKISYAGYSTRYRTVDGDEAYCVNPSMKSPSNGTYTKHYDLQNYMSSYSSNYEYLRKAMYVSYGSEGFSSSYWPSTYYNGNSMSSSAYYVCAHILLSYLYTGSSTQALYGTSSSFRNWARSELLSTSNTDSTLYKVMNDVNNGNTAPSNFDIFILHFGSAQDILSFDYTPAGKVTLYKTSEDPDFTDDRPQQYSYEGAVYYVYTDSSCATRAKTTDGDYAVLTTGTSGKSNSVTLDPGTYYVKEVTASSGFMLDPDVHTATVTADSTTKVTSVEPTSSGYATVVKKSTNSSITEGNDCYSLAGAEFTLFSLDVANVWRDENGDWCYYDSTGAKVEGYTGIGVNNNGTWYLENGKVTFNYSKTYNGGGAGGWYISGSQVHKGGHIDISDTTTELSDDNSFSGRLMIGDEHVMQLYKYNNYSHYADASFVAVNGGTYKETITAKQSDMEQYAKESLSLLGYCDIYLFASTNDLTLDGNKWTETGYIVDLADSLSAVSATFNGETVYPTVHIMNMAIDETEGGYVNTAEGKIDIGTEGLDDAVESFNRYLTIRVADYSEEDNEINVGLTVTYFDGEGDNSPDWSDGTLKNFWTDMVTETFDGVTLTTDENGNTEVVQLAPGTYYVEETKAPEKGYYWDTDDGTATGSVNRHKVDVTNANTIDNPATVTIEDIPMNDPANILIHKEDAETGSSESPGNATLEGAQFTVKFYAGDYTEDEVKSMSPTKTWVLKTVLNPYSGLVEAHFGDDCKVSGDDWYYNEDGMIVCPLGTYTIQETKAPDGYTLNGTITDKNGNQISAGDVYYSQLLAGSDDAVWIEGSNEYTAEDQVIRGDIHFVKQDGENESTDLGSIPFRITSKTTGESHIIWTDENGEYNSSSAWNKHSYNTNRGEDMYDGLWFYGYENWEEFADSEDYIIDDSLGAFPIDDYLLDELPCDANEGRTLVHTSFSITRDGWDVNLGTLENYEYGFSTYASNSAGNSKYIDAGEHTQILDSIQYWGLEAGSKYTFKAKLYDVTTGKFVAGSNGSDGVWSIDVTPTASSGTKDVSITFDATGLEGHTIVIYEYMYDADGELKYSEEDKTQVDQMLYFPKIGTELTDENGKHTVDADEQLTLVDTVEYENLPVDTYVTMTGTLYDTETGDVLLDAYGNQVTAQTTWYNETASGTVNITFVFDASLLGGDSIVAGEDASVNGVLVGHHFDWDDTTQTVEFNPAIHTVATDSETGLHYIDINGNVTIDDAVEYKGLEVGEKYTFKTEIFDLTANKTVTTSTSTVTPESRYDTAHVKVTFDATGMEGHTVVIYETVTDSTGTEIVAEENPDAEEQMIYFPKIGTELTDTNDNHTVTADGIVTLIDTVEYENLPVDTEITMTGVLYDSATGEPVIDANGHTVTTEKTWYNTSESGTIDIEFEFDASLLAGRDVVASEEVSNHGYTIGHHFDWDDEPQTVEFPTEIDTTATNAETGLHYIDPSEFITIDDAIEFKGLDPDETYTFVTELYDVTTGDFVKSHLTEKPEEEPDDVEADTEDTETETDSDAEVSDEYDIAPLAATILTKGVFTGDTFTLSASSDGEYEILYDDGLELIDEDGFRYTFMATEPGEYDVSFEYENGDVNGYRVVARDVSEEDATETIDTIVGEEFIVDISGASLVTISSTLDQMAAPGEDGDAFVANEAGTYFIALDYYDGTSVVYVVYAEDAPVEDDYLVIVTEFSSDDWYGEEDVEFTFDASNLGGHTVVIYETVYDSEGNIVALETDPEEAGQMLFFTDIGTTLTDQAGDHETMYGDDVVLIDTVDYENLPTDTWITMTGYLYDKDTGEMITDKHGDVITTQYVWYNLESSGTVEIEFIFDASLLGGHTLVAAEYAEYNGIMVGHHFDWNDIPQTEYFPKIGTELTNDWTGEHQSTIFENHDISLTDTIEYENLVPGEEYTMVGVLIDKETEEVVTDTDTGEYVTQAVKFVPEEADGVVEMTFTFNAYGMHDTYLVAFEYLYDAMGNLIAEHNDIDDEGQTVQLLVPTVWTYAAETSTGRKSIEPDEHVSITDYLDITDLIVGHTYYVYGRAVDKETGELINDHYGEPLELYIEFVADSEEMIAEFMQFEFDAEDLGGKEIVFEEYIYADADRTILICEEEDLGSAEQTVFILGPIELGTTLTDDVTGDHIAMTGDHVSLTDEVEYTGAKIGETYTVTGTLMDKETGLALTDAEGNDIKAESEPFVAEEEHGFVEITFEFDASDMAGDSVVAYEFMYNSEGTLVSAHEDINDEDQTVDFPKIGTTLVDSETGFHGAAADDHVTLVDTVEYENLIPGKTYVIEGILMDQATEKPIRDAEDKEVTAVSEPFTPTEADGSVEVLFDFDATNVDEKMYTVAYEYLYVESEIPGEDTPEENLVASHEDINDEAQTVELDEIYIGTTLLDEASGTHEADADGRVTLVDTVEYDGLIEGETYTLEGTLMDKATGTALKDTNGNNITGESTFTADGKSGVAVVTFTFDATGMNGTFAVAFEQLYDAEARLVASHEDINDEAQTVKLVHEEEEETPTTTVINNTNTSGTGPKTGDYTNIILWIVLGILAVGGCTTGIVVCRRRSRK